MSDEMIETESKEALALNILKLRKPVTYAVVALTIYATLGVPALRYDRAWGRCITITGEHINIADAPFIFFVKNGRVTFPKS